MYVFMHYVPIYVVSGRTETCPIRDFILSITCVYTVDKISLWHDVRWVGKSEVILSLSTLILAHLNYMRWRQATQVQLLRLCTGKEPVSPANPPRPHCITAQLKTKSRNTQAFILFLVCGSENELRNSK